MENTDPDLVFLEMDTYWMIRGGQNPLELMQKYKDRLLLLHQKDFKECSTTKVMYDGLIAPQQDISMEVFVSTLDPLCFTEIGTGFCLSKRLSM